MNNRINNTTNNNDKLPPGEVLWWKGKRHCMTFDGIQYYCYTLDCHNNIILESKYTGPIREDATELMKQYDESKMIPVDCHK
jgi:hypothetical protein